MLPIHVIHLPDRTDRKTHLDQELAKHGLTASFVPAVDGRTLDLDALLALGQVNFGRRSLTRGQCGCYLSHLNVLRTISESPQDIHLVLEDDVYFVANFVRKLNLWLHKTHAAEWDMFYLGLNHHSTSRVGPVVCPGVYRPVNMTWGTHAYLVKKDSAGKIIDLVTPIMVPFDTKLMEMPEIKKIALTRPIVETFRADSDTEGIV